MSHPAILVALALTLGTTLAAPAAAQSQTPAGAVYTLSNAANGNAVLAFDRAANGRLTPAGSFATGGLGSGGGLGSQNAIVLSADGMRLIGVDAGSNEISVFDIVPGGLLQRSRVASGGTMPTSLALRGNLLYVLNAGAAGNVVGFHVEPSGALSMIAGSTRSLSGNATAPAQVEFGPGGNLLFVSERATNLIDTFRVEPSGMLSGFTSYASNGATPFGFAFGRHDTLIVSEAFGGMPNASALSSYKVDGLSSLTLSAGSVPTTETAACWVAVTKDGRYAYTTNTASGSVSGYRVGMDGALTLLDADGVTGFTGIGSTPLDAALSRDSRFLYVLARNAAKISVFRVRQDGSLAFVPAAEGIPTTSAGLASR